MRTMRSPQLRTLAVALVVLGLVLLALGVVYFTVPVNKLPSFMGHIPGYTTHHTKRALASTVLGILCLIWGAITMAKARTTRARHARAREWAYELDRLA